MQSLHVSGIVSTANNGNATWLPLASLAAHIFITDVSSRTILSQVYVHDGPNMLAEAYYIFPVPAGAAVCSFSMETNNGVVLEGIVKEISDAKKDYEQAMSENRLASLLEQFRQDIFVVCIGSLQPKTTIKIMISYVMDLCDDDQDDTIRYQLSAHVGGRYGAPATSILYPIQGTAHRARLSIIADIQMSGSILHVQSNYNLVDVPYTQKNLAGGPFHVARKQFINSDDVSLSKDFLLVVQAMDLDVSRCIAERDGESTALSLTIMPRFQSTNSQDREYLFLIDQSGSMAGNKLRMAKDAALLLLKSLPAEHSWFNICSFATGYQSLWTSGSRQNSDSSLHESISYVETIQAGSGTRLTLALRYVISARNRSMSTSVFVLTDGFIEDEDAAFNIVRREVESVTTHNSFRVFALGIGDGASTTLCEGLASVGNGESFMTLDGEDISSKCVRILGSMETPEVKDLTVDWGVPPGGVQQAPFRLSISPNKRLSVTAILPRGRFPPSHVTLSGSLTDNSPIQYVVPVTPTIPLRSSLVEKVLGVSIDLPPLIHTLAAHRLILDYERGLAPPTLIPAWQTLTPGTRQDVINRLIVQLGVHYQIASSRTAFIATNTTSRRRRKNQPASNNAGNAAGTTTSNVRSNSTASASGRSSNNPPGTASGSGTASNNAPGTAGGSGTASNNPPGTASGYGMASNNPPGTAGGSGTASNNPPGAASGSGTTRSGSSGTAAASGTTSNGPSGIANSSGTASKNPTGSAPSGGNSHNSQNNLSPSSQGSSPGASRMPGAFRGSPPSRQQHPGSNEVPSVLFFDSNSTEPDEILCLFGGKYPPVLYTAPPLRHELVFVTWFKSLPSFLYRPWKWLSSQNQSATRTHQTASSAAMFNKSDDPAFRETLRALSNLQSLQGLYDAKNADSLSRITGIATEKILNLPADVLSAMENRDNPLCIWATAIAIAFLREKCPSHWVTWKGLARKSIKAGSLACGGEGVFNKIVTHAVALFQ